MLFLGKVFSQISSQQSSADLSVPHRLYICDHFLPHWFEDTVGCFFLLEHAGIAFLLYCNCIDSIPCSLYLAHNLLGWFLKPDQSLIRLSAASRSSEPLAMRDFQNFKILRSSSKIAGGSCPCKGIFQSLIYTSFSVFAGSSSRASLKRSVCSGIIIYFLVSSEILISSHLILLVLLGPYSRPLKCRRNAL